MSVLQAGMQKDILVTLAHLSDAELVTGLKGFIARERGETAQIVAHLAELDTRDVYLREGYPSLFVDCRDALGLSEDETYNRIEVARAARQFPVILGMLAEGAINLTAVRLLAPHLTLDNHCGVLEAARGKRKSEIAEIVARVSPRPDVRPSIRKLPSLPPDPPPAAAPLLAQFLPAAATLLGQPSPAAALPVSPPPVRPAAMTPLSPDRYKLQLTISGDTLEKLRLAKDMLSHGLPSGDDAAILDRALTTLLVDLAKKRFADTQKSPQLSRGTKPGSRHVPAAVKRAVWLRDLGRCAFIGTSGHRCNERRFVEFHHLDPHVLGGEATVERIALLCRRHNDYESRLYFGKRIPKDDGASVQEVVAPYGSRPLDAPRTCSGTGSSPRPRPPLCPPEVTTNT